MIYRFVTKASVEERITQVTPKVLTSSYKKHEKWNVLWHDINDGMASYFDDKSFFPCE